MATTFPTTLDSFTNPISTNKLNSPSHADQHTNANDAIAAIEAKVGINSSAVTTSLDFRINRLETLPFNAQTGTTYSFQASDELKTVTLANASNITATIPLGLLSAGKQINIVSLGAGIVTISPAVGVTLRSEGARYRLAAQYAVASLLCINTNEWLLFGNVIV